MKRLLKVKGSNGSDSFFLNIDCSLQWGRFLGLLATGDGYNSASNWGPCQKYLRWEKKDTANKPPKNHNQHFSPY